MNTRHMGSFPTSLASGSPSSYLIKPTDMEGENLQQPPPAAADAVSRVLDDDDLLIEILIRVGFPTTLVRAALVSKHWLGHVSDRAFLRRFRELHPPRLLGFYVEDLAFRNAPPPFVSMLPQPRELADVISRARFNQLPSSYEIHIHECRKGSVIHGYDCESNSLARVHSPLCPQRGFTILPSLPSCGLQGNEKCIIRQVLSQEDGDDLSYFFLHVECNPNAQESEYFRVKVYRLQDGCWHETLHILGKRQLPFPRDEPKAVLVDTKIYLLAGLHGIIVLDLTASSLSTIQFPQGADHRRIGTALLSRANDASGVYLINVKEFQLRVWLHKGDDWMLVDTICLREMCDNLKKSGCKFEDEHTPRLMNQVVDYGDFLFLRMGGYVLHFDIKCRILCKVYESEDGCLGDINPFMMIWPPKFPAIKYDPVRNAT